jgi:hypothetical protein
MFLLTLSIHGLDPQTPVVARLLELVRGTLD